VRKHWSSAAINVKSLKRHLITEGPTDANAYASLVCTYARWPITGELRKVPTVHILQGEKSLAPRRLTLDASRERPIVRFALDHVHVAGIVVGRRLAEIVGINLAMTVAVLPKLLS
jgi:hypothetical protein